MVTNIHALLLIRTRASVAVKKQSFHFEIAIFNNTRIDFIPQNNRSLPPTTYNNSKRATTRALPYKMYMPLCHYYFWRHQRKPPPQNKVPAAAADDDDSTVDGPSAMKIRKSGT